MPATDAVLAHGWTLTQIHQLAKQAVNMSGVYASNYLDRWDAAYGAILIHLYEAPHWPTRHQLVAAGATAVRALVEQNLQARGYRNAWQGEGSRPRYNVYWTGLRHIPSHETRVVERLAITQILPHLTPAEMRAVSALAAAGDYQQAAQLAGVHPTTFGGAIVRARRRALSLWLEGETPVKPRPDRRVGSRTATPPTECPRGHAYTDDNLASNGSGGGHRCKQCHRDDYHARKAGAVRAPRVLRPCGTYSAWQRHRRRGEPVDAACEAARVAHNAARRPAVAA